MGERLHLEQIVHLEQMLCLEVLNLTTMQSSRSR